MTAIEQLRRAVKCLHLEVPASVMADFVPKVEAVIAQAEDDALYRQCLEAGGVDNWDWYSESLQPYWEKQDAEDS